MNTITNDIKYPENISKIITGRSTTENWLKKNYPKFYEYITNKYTNGLTINEKIYMFYHNMIKRPICKMCGNPVKFVNYSHGFSTYCCPKCAQIDTTVRDKHKKSCKDKYGDDCFKEISKIGRKTKKEKYGNENYNNIDKAKKTCLEKYGVDNVMKCKEKQEKSKKTCLEKYGTEYYFNSQKYKDRHNECLIKTRKTCLKKYGVINPMQSDIIKTKVNETCLEKYGCKWNCMRKEAHHSHNVDSKPNMYIKELLKKYNIQYTTEFVINDYIFDFKIGDTLLEMNPYPTHNINWSPYKNVNIDKNYHQIKTNTAKEAGFKVINIWDWDNVEMIINSLIPKINIYARNCDIKIISKKDAKLFLSQYHFQGSCNNQKIIYGLYYNNELIQLMSFGKPRYNKNYEYELIRLCTKFGYNIIGGALKLFSHFIKDYNPSSIISYCDDSKFTGSIYNKLGFKLKNKPAPSKHWYKHKGNIHITDNLLRQKGYDKLFGTNYGKGASNENLMLENKFVEIYDAGQSTWTWNL